MCILTFWQKFGRRYFWPHLLLGVMAAGIGVSPILNAVVEDAIQNTLISQDRFQTFDTAFAQNNKSQRTQNTVNYWQQHAVRTAIRQLTFAFSSNVPVEKENTNNSSDLPSEIMLETLYALLSQRSPHQQVFTLVFHLPSFPYLFSSNPGLWIAQVQGIRAGPYLA